MILHIVLIETQICLSVEERFTVIQHIPKKTTRIHTKMIPLNIHWQTLRTEKNMLITGTRAISCV